MRLDGNVSLIAEPDGHDNVTGLDGALRIRQDQERRTGR